MIFCDQRLLTPKSEVISEMVKSANSSGRIKCGGIDLDWASPVVGVLHPTTSNSPKRMRTTGCNRCGKEMKVTPANLSPVRSQVNQQIPQTGYFIKLDLLLKHLCQGALQPVAELFQRSFARPVRAGAGWSRKCRSCVKTAEKSGLRASFGGTPPVALPVGSVPRPDVATAQIPQVGYLA